mmetsp:Transcript_5892/g.18602  ORF Transcript_5892/g.18602 Transcript_5892/m.18602 type:complete len:241 (-) Transcript_5892:225-947(-)
MLGRGVCLWMSTRRCILFPCGSTGTAGAHPRVSRGCRSGRGCWWCSPNPLVLLAGNATSLRSGPQSPLPVLAASGSPRGEPRRGGAAAAAAAGGAVGHRRGRARLRDGRDRRGRQPRHRLDSGSVQPGAGRAPRGPRTAARGRASVGVDGAASSAALFAGAEAGKPPQATPGTGNQCPRTVHLCLERCAYVGTFQELQCLRQLRYAKLSIPSNLLRALLQLPLQLLHLLPQQVVLALLPQ